MKRTLIGLVAALAVVVITTNYESSGRAGTASAAGLDQHITLWDLAATQAAVPGNTPAEQFPIFAYLNIATYDSVVAIEGGYEPFLVHASPPDDASAEAAVAGAAKTILLHYLPGQATVINTAYANALALIPDGRAEDDGVAFGTSVAVEVIAARASDGFKAPVAYTPSDPLLPGDWVPSGPTPIGTYSGSMTPFVLDSASQFRPAGPPALDSKKWAVDYNEVKEIGSATSTSRTAEQTLAARFWGENPVAQAHGGFRRFVTDHQLDIVDASRFMAMISVTQADAFIACFDAKYQYDFWRPKTAIQGGEMDGNPATAGDSQWTQLLPGIPNHPEYPSAHSCVTPAAAEVTSRFLGTEQIAYTIPSLTGLGDRYYAKAKDLSNEVANARIWGGIHFRTAVEDGTDIGRKTAHRVLSQHFKSAN